MTRDALTIAIVLLVSRPVPGQAPTHVEPGVPGIGMAASDTGVMHFLARARVATAKYRDPEQAVMDGYRPIGTDFPGMGEHWIRISTLFDGRFDAGRPAVLEYAAIRGRRALVGVAYALPLLEGESPPAFLPMQLWHEHSGTVAEETDLLAQVMSSHGAMHGARLAMVHAWIWLPNPAGMFASDNWALPFARAGLEPPAADPGAVAGRALSLVSGGDAFYAGVFHDVGQATGSDSIAIALAIGAARARSQRWITVHRNDASAPAPLEELRDIWAALWRAIDASVSPAVRERLSGVDGR